MAEKKFIGELLLKLENDSVKIVRVYRDGKEIFLDREIVHPSNQASVEGWVREAGLIWKLIIKKFKFVPLRVIDNKEFRKF
jgi:hypothetical protein